MSLSKVTYTIRITVPPQEYSMELDEDDYAEWAEDTTTDDPLYDRYIHHVLSSDPVYFVEIWDGEELVYRS